MRTCWWRTSSTPPTATVVVPQARPGGSNRRASPAARARFKSTTSSRVERVGDSEAACRCAEASRHARAGRSRIAPRRPAQPARAATVRAAGAAPPPDLPLQRRTNRDRPSEPFLQALEGHSCWYCAASQGCVMRMKPTPARHGRRAKPGGCGAAVEPPTRRLRPQRCCNSAPRCAGCRHGPT